MKLCGDCESLSLNKLTMDWREKSIKNEEYEKGNCIEVKFQIKNNNIIFNNIIIPFNSDYRIAVILTSIGRIKESRLFYKDTTTSIYIENNFLYEIYPTNENIIKSNICGNLASTIVNFCIGNNQFMIIGKSKEIVIEAFKEFKSLIEYIREIRKQLCNTNPLY
ncbi:MAG: hypothetical protein QXQ97_03950 [Saccharolobus sp.]